MWLDHGQEEKVCEGCGENYAEWCEEYANCVRPFYCCAGCRRKGPYPSSRASRPIRLDSEVVEVACGEIDFDKYPFEMDLFDFHLEVDLSGIGTY